MNRWQALVKITDSFNSRGSPRLAFATIIVFGVFSLAALAIILHFGAAEIVGSVMHFF